MAKRSDLTARQGPGPGAQSSKPAVPRSDPALTAPAQEPRWWSRISPVASRGAIAGLVAGWGFILGNMLWYQEHGKPAIAPFLAISTIFDGTNVPVKSPASAIVGLTLHIGLTMGFGIGFAFLAWMLLPNVRSVLLASVIYGLLLYVVNFQLLGRYVWPWFTNPKGPPQGFEVWIHAVYGLLLAPFFLGARWRLGGLGKRAIRTRREATGTP